MWGSNSRAQDLESHIHQTEPARSPTVIHFNATIKFFKNFIKKTPNNTLSYIHIAAKTSEFRLFVMKMKMSEGTGQFVEGVGMEKTLRELILNLDLFGCISKPACCMSHILPEESQQERYVHIYIKSFLLLRYHLILFI